MEALRDAVSCRVANSWVWAVTAQNTKHPCERMWFKLSSAIGHQCHGAQKFIFPLVLVSVIVVRTAGKRVDQLTILKWYPDPLQRLRRPTKSMRMWKNQSLAVVSCPKGITIRLSTLDYWHWTRVQAHGRISFSYHDSGRRADPEWGFSNPVSDTYYLAVLA